MTEFSEQEAEIMIFFSEGHWDLTLESLLRLGHWVPFLFSCRFLLAPCEMSKADRFPPASGFRLGWFSPDKLS